MAASAVNNLAAEARNLEFKLPFLIITPNLIIRPLIHQDKAVITDAIKQSLKVLHMWLPWVDTPPKMDEYTSICERFYVEAETKQAYHFVVYHNENFLGMCSLVEVDLSKGIAQLGFWCKVTSEDENFIEAVNAVLRYGFEQARIKDFYVPCVVGNYMNELAAKELNFKLKSINLINGLQIKMFKISKLADLPELEIHWVDEPN